MQLHAAWFPAARQNAAQREDRSTAMQRSSAAQIWEFVECVDEGRDIEPESCMVHISDKASYRR